MTPQEKHIADLKKYGYGIEVVEKNGTRCIVVKSIPPIDKLFMDFFNGKEVDIPNREVLYASYKSELGKNEACTSCSKGAIMRKYKAKIYDALQQAGRTAGIPGSV